MGVGQRAAALLAGIGVALLLGGSTAPGAPGPAGAAPSAHCHAVDGTFTTCTDGSHEWSDVPSHFFAKTNAYLYADQADLDPTLEGPKSKADTFELMYDECGFTRALRPGEYFLVSFDTVEEEDSGEPELVRYAVHVFDDGTIIFFENGKPVPAADGKLRVKEIEGQRGDAAFGPSPHCPADHLTVEFEIKLTATGLKLNGGYSPDPIFWGATPPKEPPVAADDEGDLEDNDSVTVPVTSNDTDSDDPIDQSSVVVVDQPEHGTATPNGDGTVTFTKDKDFKHDDTFSYTVNDNDGLKSNTAKVDITKPCSKDVGASIDDKSSPAAAGKKTKKGTDVDKDGLLHEDEVKAGTDPCHYDTDGDGLADPWEVSPGISGAGFDLNGDGSSDVSRDQVFGANDPPSPLHKDVYAEIDFFDCNLGGCMPGDPMVHDLDPTAVANVKSMFAGLGAQNPDKSPGITLHLQPDEHIKHDPNCMLPPFARPNFGTVDQRTNPQITDAKALAYRYIVSGHSTLRGGGCPTPSLWEIANNMFRESAPLPDYDNTPFGRATVGGSDIALSLGPVWICPRNKRVGATIVLPPPFPIVISPSVTVCDRESILDPGIFPTTVPTSSGLKKLKQPYSRALGRQDPANPDASEQRGIIQVQGRALAHLLGHALGISGDGGVGNDPVFSGPPPGDYWPPEAYPGGTGSFTYADSLHTTSDGGDHLTFSRTGGGSSTAPEFDVFGQPILEFLLTDRDADGVIENDDNCSGVFNPLQEDLDRDGVGDLCDRDLDADGIDNTADAHPDDTDNDGTPNLADSDDDGDGVADTADNCKLNANATQRDTDHDGKGDACDDDSDGDGVLDTTEVGGGSDRYDAASTPEAVDFESSCSNGRDDDRDGKTDGADNGCVDTDADGLADTFDNCPTTPNFGWSDVDGDGLGDLCDADADNDGFSNDLEEELGSEQFEADSTPEALEESGTCTDGVDNDRDGLTDAQDLRCQGETTAKLQAIVDNGLVQLGVNPQGHLNVLGTERSSGTGTPYVGLRYLPTKAEATAPGCLCEGWGVADPDSGVTGYANIDSDWDFTHQDGVHNLSLQSFRRTVDSTVSVVRIGSTFRVTHDYHPSVTPNLYEATVTIENTSDHDVNDVRYRRVMDWDVEPTAFSEFVTVVTIQGSERAKNVRWSSDDGFASANPLADPVRNFNWYNEPQCHGDPSVPGAGPHACIGDFTDAGPADHGALFDFGFGKLAPHDTVSFNIYYGAAGSEADADRALGQVRAEVYSYGQPNCPSFRCPGVDGPHDGKPNTFIFAFSKVGGETVKPPDTDADGVLDELDNCPFASNDGQADSNGDGIGDACSPAKLVHTTAGFLQALLDGTTTVEPSPLTLGEEPSSCERLVPIVRFRVDAGFETDADEFADELVDSMVEGGLVDEGDAKALVACVLAHLDRAPPVVKVTFPAPDGQNGWFVHSPVVGSVTATDPGKVAAITCTGATVGPIPTVPAPTATATLTVDGDGTHDVSCTATDAFGNTGAGVGSEPSATVKIDTIVPSVDLSFGAPDGDNGFYVHSPVAGTATASDANGVAALACTGASAGPLEGGGRPPAWGGPCRRRRSRSRSAATEATTSRAWPSTRPGTRGTPQRR